jgi:CheY-like chemotaxis protein
VESPETTQIQAKKAKTILLAEDNDLYARAISTRLLDQGYRLAVVHTGLQAVQQVRNLSPDLILLDLQMPEIGGMEALNLIRENTELRNVPVIMWSALSLPGDQEYYLRQGVNVFLQKPLFLPDLTEKIAQLLAD